MENFPTPLLEETFEKLVSRWAKISSYQESGLIYSTSKSGLVFRLNQLQSNDGLLKKYFDQKKIIVLDLEAQAIEDFDDLALGKITEPTVIFLLGVDSAIETHNSVLLQQFNQLAMSPNVSVLCFVHKDYTHPVRRKLLENLSAFWQNTLLDGLYSPEDSWQFLKYLETKWHTNFDEKLKTEIVKKCGGHFWLVKECCRFIRDGNPVGAVFAHDQLKHRLEVIWGNFLPSEQSLLEKLLANETELTKLEQHSAEFLVKSGWLKQKGEKLCCAVPLLTQYLQERAHQFISVTPTQDICFKGVSISHLFSHQERALIRVLLEQNGQVVSREKLAESIWNDDQSAEYSDWALDQLVSRLRKKTTKLGLSKHWITTIRKKGLVISDHA